MFTRSAQLGTNRGLGRVRGLGLPAGYEWQPPLAPNCGRLKATGMIVCDPLPEKQSAEDPQPKATPTNTQPTNQQPEQSGGLNAWLNKPIGNSGFSNGHAIAGVGVLVLMVTAFSGGRRR